MGGFAVRVGSQEVAPTAWGSRRARQLCKRLAVAAGQPVPRDLLMEMLWPGEVDANRLGARLSVLLSNIRRVLGGGLVGDSAAVALDVATVDLDLRRIHEALARGDDEAVIEAHVGPILPEDAYEDWAMEAREHVVRAVIGAHRRLATEAASAGRVDDVERHTAGILELDPFDEWAHEMLVRTLAASDRPGDAARAEDRYRQRMAELGVRPQELLDPRATIES
jgi:DNA-binding SARP family transcriptional activator